MGHAAASQRLSVTEYLAWKCAQPEKHEYHLGEVFVMAGGSARHTTSVKPMDPGGTGGWKAATR